MNTVLLGYARLARPANLPTAAADILAGVAIAGVFVISGSGQGGSILFLPVLLLVLSSIFLYAGGVIFNDVFDLSIDRIERPERPIPSGIVPLKAAAVYGTAAMLIGIVLAFCVGRLSGIIACMLTFSILIYDSLAKKSDLLGPLVMGLCRGLNLILGISVLGSLDFWWMAIVPIVYIFAITLISRGEVHGENKNHIVLAGVLYATVIFGILAISYFYTDSMLMTLLYILVFVIMIFRPLVRAYSENSPANIKKAVMAGVISLIVLDAAIAATFSIWWYGLVILALLPLSIGLSKLFAVT
ncbi:UbiA-like protein EboC [Pareuzebyella sediminis]|uniref:UbiA-like protein EboC n=1 Tax=Pareuzebyella sediminis TaxID=2607998 RepID=UPI0011EBBF43|nr:UbiA-like protein EboC [Pareuzebyella sediminis]